MEVGKTWNNIKHRGAEEDMKMEIEAIFFGKIKGKARALKIISCSQKKIQRSATGFPY